MVDTCIFIGFVLNLPVSTSFQITFLKANEVEPIAIYFTIEMLKIAEVLKKANIIHADIKPENFLLQRS